MKTIHFRLPEDAATRIREVAEAEHLPFATTIRKWLLDRLDVERDREEGKQ